MLEHPEGLATSPYVKVHRHWAISRQPIDFVGERLYICINRKEYKYARQTKRKYWRISCRI